MVMMLEGLQGSILFKSFKGNAFPAKLKALPRGSSRAVE
jgi:hypothetical protein